MRDALKDLYSPLKELDDDPQAASRDRRLDRPHARRPPGAGHDDPAALCGGSVGELPGQPDIAVTVEVTSPSATAGRDQQPNRPHPRRTVRDDLRVHRCRVGPLLRRAPAGGRSREATRVVQRVQLPGGPGLQPLRHSALHRAGEDLPRLLVRDRYPDVPHQAPEAAALLPSRPPRSGWQRAYPGQLDQGVRAPSFGCGVLLRGPRHHRCPRS